uniref:Uncharacterized protein n=1 Tax=Ditylenchus dipsaci TaxID=166011 RepID=A0A915EI91_9BILA
MPQKSAEAHRALELLEQYHAVLNRPSDSELKFAIEKVIGIFKANLFQALCDIQDFYDNTLMSERVSLAQKTNETRRLAERWENNPPFGGTAPRHQPFSTGHTRDISRESYDRLAGPATTKPYTNGVDTTNKLTSSSHSYSYQEQSRQLTKDDNFFQRPDRRARPRMGSGGCGFGENQIGLGFSISGGKDRVADPDHYIRVTNISPGGAVARDGRIRDEDVILKVNNVDCINVEHQVAVDALKNSGSVVRLLVKRLKSSQPAPHLNESLFRGAPAVPSHVSPSVSTGFPSYTPPAPPSNHLHSMPPSDIQRLEQTPGVKKMELLKTLSPDGMPRGLGFSIAGGIGNEHYPNDTGIFVTRIIEGSPAYYNGRLQKGDQILAVDNTILENVTHQFAVDTLKATGNKVSLLYLKNPTPTLSRLPVSMIAVLEVGSEPRIVTLRKGEAGLGFNIVGGEDREPIYVSHVIPGGVADLSGNVRKVSQIAH